MYPNTRIVGYLNSGVPPGTLEIKRSFSRNRVFFSPYKYTFLANSTYESTKVNEQQIPCRTFRVLFRYIPMYKN